MTKEFNSLDEIQEYYDEKSDTYIFKGRRENAKHFVLDGKLEVEND